MNEQVPWVVVAITAITMIGSALLVHEVGKRAADGRLGRNSVAGIRTRATMASDSAWPAGHRAARGANDVGCAGVALAGVLAVLLRGHAGAFTAAVLLGMTWCLAWVLVSARRAVRASAMRD